MLVLSLKIGFFAIFGALLSTAYCEVGKALPFRKLEWWEKGVIYQIYPRSFKDSNGDGIGDLRGIAEEIGYLDGLGVKAVWISPLYESPMADFGYDITNFKAIDPIFGTMTDLHNLKELLHEHGIKLVMDFVPNHTSDEHQWFIKSVNREEPYTNYYVWANPKKVNGRIFPPNNWLSSFGGSAWTWNKKRQQFYLHQFHIKQPDLNYRNPRVLQEMKDVLTFWMSHGVDGFRMDAVFALFEDKQLRNEPLSNLPDVRPTDEQYLLHNYTRDQPENYDVIVEFRKLLDDYSAETNTVRFMAVEVYSGSLTNIMKYYGTQLFPGAHFPFNFLFITDLSQQSNAVEFKQVIESWYKNLPEGKWPNWVIGNHDQSRPASRYGTDMLDGIHMLQLVLPGTTITYMGDEIGMQDTFIRWDQTLDPAGINSGRERYTRFSRDPERTPFQWNGYISGGFSRNETTWLPVNPHYWTHNLEVERTCERSHYKVFRKLVTLKDTPVIQYGNLNVYALSKWVLVITRSLTWHPTIVVVVNIGTEFRSTKGLSEAAKLPEELNVKLCSVNCAYVQGTVVPTDMIFLPPKAAILCSTDGTVQHITDFYNHILADHNEINSETESH